MSESRVTWATFVPILLFRGLSVLDLGPMYATDRQTDVRQTSSDESIGHNKQTVIIIGTSYQDNASSKRTVGHFIHRIKLKVLN